MNKQELDEKILEQVLAYVSDERMEEIAGECAPDEDITLSPRFEKRMSRIIRRRRLKDGALGIKKSLLKTGVLFVIIALVFSVVVCHVGAMRVPFVHIFSVAGEHSTTVYINEQATGGETMPALLRGIYMPSYIPDGYAIEGISKNDGIYTVGFRGPDGAEFTLKSLGADSAVVIDGGGPECREVDINGEPAQLVSNEGELKLVFQCDQKAFELAGRLSEHEIIKIAQSLECTQ